MSLLDTHGRPLKSLRVSVTASRGSAPAERFTLSDGTGFGIVASSTALRRDPHLEMHTRGG